MPLTLIPICRSHARRISGLRLVRWTSTTKPCRGEFSKSTIPNADKATLSARVMSSKVINEQVERSYRKLDSSFRNTEEAFRSKTNHDLLRGWTVLKLCTFNFLVRNNEYLMKFGRRVLGKRLFNLAMRATFFGHFVAGESEEDIAPTIQKMKAFGVKSILDYSVEADLNADEGKNEQSLEQSTVPNKASPTASGKAVEGPGKSPTTPFINAQQVKESRFQYYTEFDRRDRALSRTYYYKNEPECDKHAETFCNSIRAVSKVTDGTGLAAVKLTALGRPQFLLHLSEVIAQTQSFYQMLTGVKWEDLVTSRLSREMFISRLEEYGIKTDKEEVKDWFSSMDFDSDGYVDIYEWGKLLGNTLNLGKLFKVVNLRTGKMEPLTHKLTPEQEQQFDNMIGRLQKILDCALEHNVRVMVDAEQTYFQPAINRLTMEMMRKYNRNAPVVFNTYQCYLKSTLSSLRMDMNLAKRENIFFGAKLVRGAYVDQERKRAAALNYEDPIQPNYEATSENYRTVLCEMFNEIGKRELGKVSAMVASHNEDTIRFAVEKMHDMQISPLGKIICFAQLYGMCDQVSFSLGQAGYSVYKYVPYGPVEEVLPYLSRRALENSGLLKKSRIERNLIAKELKRRIFNGQIWYDPMKCLPEIPDAAGRLLGPNSAKI